MADSVSAGSCRLDALHCRHPFNNKRHRRDMTQLAVMCALLNQTSDDSGMHSITMDTVRGLCKKRRDGASNFWNFSRKTVQSLMGWADTFSEKSTTEEDSDVWRFFEAVSLNLAMNLSLISDGFASGTAAALAMRLAAMENVKMS